MKLNELRENPNNPSHATEEQLNRLAQKLKRVPLGLTAMRIAYVTDDPIGCKTVISGNKRLRVLKKAYGEDAELPDEYFQDVTSMSEAERHEFIVTANVSDGSWDLDKLLEQYDKGELEDLFNEDEFTKLLGEKDEWDQLDEIVDDIEPPEAAKPKKTVKIVVPEQLFESVDEIEQAVRTNVISKFPECEVVVV